MSENETVDFNDSNTEMDPVVKAAVEATLDEYRGQWERLVSTTNWDKGKIICQWRDALIDREAAPSQYSDQAWADLVGNVTPQHVGRLRRVFQLFGETFESYEGLYWSHFQASLDWDDADEWLDQACTFGWSVSRMRKERWEANGAPEAETPRDEDIVTTEIDEDIDPDDMDVAARDDRGARDVDSNEEAPFDIDGDDDASIDGLGEIGPDGEPVRPFENIGELPQDLADAMEQMKLVIIQHRLAGWRDVSCDQVIEVLNSLKAMTMQPVEAA